MLNAREQDELYRIAMDPTKSADDRLSDIQRILAQKVQKRTHLTIKYISEGTDNWAGAVMMYESVDFVTVSRISLIVDKIPTNTQFRIFRQDRRIGDDLVAEGNSDDIRFNPTNLDNPYKTSETDN